MILTFADHEGDAIAVESATIVGLSVGTINGPHRDILPYRVTLIWAAGVAQPFMVAAPFAEVLDAWRVACTAGGQGDQPGYHGWPVNWWDATAPPPWRPKAGWPK